MRNARSPDARAEAATKLGALAKDGGLGSLGDEIAEALAEALEDDAPLRPIEVPVHTPPGAPMQVDVFDTGVVADCAQASLARCGTPGLVALLRALRAERGGATQRAPAVVMEAPASALAGLEAPARRELYERLRGRARAGAASGELEAAMARLDQAEAEPAGAMQALRARLESPRPEDRAEAITDLATSEDPEEAGEVLVAWFLGEGGEGADAEPVDHEQRLAAAQALGDGLGASLDPGRAAALLERAGQRREAWGPDVVGALCLAASWARPRSPGLVASSLEVAGSRWIGGPDPFRDPGRFAVRAGQRGARNAATALLRVAETLEDAEAAALGEVFLNAAEVCRPILGQALAARGRPPEVVLERLRGWLDPSDLSACRLALTCVLELGDAAAALVPEVSQVLADLQGRPRAGPACELAVAALVQLWRCLREDHPGATPAQLGFPTLVELELPTVPPLEDDL